MTTATVAQPLTEQVIASEMLNIMKTSIKSQALALTEVATTDVRAMILRHFADTVKGHELITDFMIQCGWYKAYEIGAQIQADIQNANTALQSAN